MEETIGQSEPVSSPESSVASSAPQSNVESQSSPSSPAEFTGQPGQGQSKPQQYVASPDQRNGAPSSYGTSPASVNAPPQQQQAPAPQQYTVREAVSRYGYDASGYTNDAEAIRDLVSKAQQSQQLQQMAQYGHQYLQNAAEFNAWMKEKQAAEAAKSAPAEKESWWKAPEFDPEWRSKVVRDSNGNLTTLPGAPPDLINKYSNAIEHRDKFLEQFAFDPVGSIKPGIEEVAKNLVEKILSERDARQQEQNFAKDYISQNSSWLHQRDQNGKLVYDQTTGKPALAPYGKAFAHYVAQAASVGIRDENARASYAASLVQRDYLKHQAQREAQQNAQYRDYYQQSQMRMQQAREQAAQQTAQRQQGDVQKQQFVQQAPSRQGNALTRIGNSDAAAFTGNGAVKNKSLNLAQRMRQSLEANGISEGSIKRSR